MALTQEQIDQQRKEAEELLSALDSVGIDTNALRKSRQPPTRETLKP